MTYERCGLPEADAEDFGTWCRAQDLFLARAREAIDRGRRDGSGIIPEELLRRLDCRLDAARKALAERVQRE